MGGKHIVNAAVGSGLLFSSLVCRVSHHRVRGAWVSGVVPHVNGVEEVCVSKELLERSITVLGGRYRRRSWASCHDRKTNRIRQSRAGDGLKIACEEERGPICGKGGHVFTKGIVKGLGLFATGSRHAVDGHDPQVPEATVGMSGSGGGGVSRGGSGIWLA